MAVYSKFLSLINGVSRTVDLSTNTLNVSALEIGGVLLSQSGVYASFSGQVAGMSSDVVITAQNPGAIGNSVSLSFNGVLTVSGEIAAWNGSNPSNMVTLTSGIGTQVPNNGTSINLSGGSSVSGSSLIGDFNVYSNFTPTSPTIAGALAGIDTALSGLSASAITQLHGDATAMGPGNAALTLATVNSNVGSFGSASNSVSFTVNAKGLVTAASASAIQIAESQVTGLVSDLSGKLSNALAQNHIFVGNASNIATDVAMSGEASIVASGAVTLSNAAVIAKLLTGYTAGAGTVSSSDSILSAIEKIDGNDALKIPLTQKGAANGVATLDGSGHIPLSQLSIGTMEYKGAWNASTNSPALADGTGSNGDIYRVSVAGTQDLGSGSQSYFVGDLVIYNGSIWERSPLADGVVSVNGSTGAVTVNAINQLTGDVTAGPASGSQSKAATIAAIQGTAVSGTTGSGNVVFSASPTFTGTIVAAAANFSGAISASNFSGSSSGTNTGDVSIGTANGLSLSGQVLSLQLASASLNGALSSTDWSTFNSKLTSALTSAHIFVGNGSNLATDVAVSGDLSLANTGAFTINNAAVTLAKMASDSVDENKVVSTSFDPAGALNGGSGTKFAVRVDGKTVSINGSNNLEVQSAPSNINVMVAGESFAANTSFSVRMAVSGETAGRVYKADQDASSSDKFWSVGIAYSTSAVSAGQNINVILLGQYNLQSSDSAFAGGDIGKPVYLLSSGAFSTTAPTSAGFACYKLGNVMTTTKMMVEGQLNGIN